MMEGGSVERYTRALILFRENRKTYFALAEKLTVAIAVYLQMQIAAGVDALQIFDSHGGRISPNVSRWGGLRRRLLRPRPVCPICRV